MRARAARRVRSRDARGSAEPRACSRPPPLVVRPSSPIPMDRYEAHVLAMLHHPNITTFYGVSSFDEQLLLVTEFVPHGLDRLVRAFHQGQQAQHQHATTTGAAPRPRRRRGRRRLRRAARRARRERARRRRARAAAARAARARRAAAARRARRTLLPPRRLRAVDRALRHQAREHPARGGARRGRRGGRPQFHLKLCDLGRPSSRSAEGTVPRDDVGHAGLHAARVRAHRVPRAGGVVIGRARGVARGLGLVGAVVDAPRAPRALAPAARRRPRRAMWATSRRRTRPAASRTRPATPARVASAGGEPRGGGAPGGAPAARPAAARRSRPYLDDPTKWDIFGLGVLAWHMWTLRHPFEDGPEDGRPARSTTPRSICASRARERALSPSGGWRRVRRGRRTARRGRPRCALVERTWARDPADRPRAEHVAAPAARAAAPRSTRSTAPPAAARRGPRRRSTRWATSSSRRSPSSRGERAARTRVPPPRRPREGTLAALKACTAPPTCRVGKRVPKPALSSKWPAVSAVDYVGLITFRSRRGTTPGARELICRHALAATTLAATVPRPPPPRLPPQGPLDDRAIGGRFDGRVYRCSGRRRSSRASHLTDVLSNSEQ